MKKTEKQLERIVKGFANHRRIEILRLLKREPERTVGEISSRLRTNMKTVSEHLRRLALAGLVLKRYKGQSVHHKLTPRATKILAFLAMLE